MKKNATRVSKALNNIRKIATTFEGNMLLQCRGSCGRVPKATADVKKLAEEYKKSAVFKNMG